MSAPVHIDVFSDVINDLMKELHSLPHSTAIIFQLLVKNVDSPVLPEIQHLSLSKLDTIQMTALIPVLANLTSLTSLALPECKPSPDHLKFILTECSALSKLQSLDFNKMGDLGFEYALLLSQCALLLSQSTIITKLTSLNLEGCPDLEYQRDKTSTALIALLSSPVVKNLTHLNLAGIQINGPIATALATSPFLSNLVALNLSDTCFDADVAQALAASTTLTNITDLNFSSNAAALIHGLFSPRSLFAKKLQSLNLKDTNLVVDSLELVLKASPHLTELNLYGNKLLGPAGAELIAASTHNLTKLDLSYCNITNDGYAALAASTVLLNLHELELTANAADVKSIIALVNSPVMSDLTHLNLSGTHQGPQVLVAIAHSPFMSKLQHPAFHSNQVGDEGVIALAQSTTLTNLKRLDLGFNKIGPKGINALCASPVVSKLTRIDLYMNSIGHFIANTLDRHPQPSTVSLN